MPVTSEERPSDSSFVLAIWRTQNTHFDSFISTAAIHWEMVMMRHKGKTTLTVRGPETKATSVPILADAEWLGITFKLGTFMPYLPPISLRDRHDTDLPEATSQSFWLQGSAWEFPTYENADIFVKRLEREGLLMHDPVVEAVRQSQPPDLSIRAIQYRFLRATGLTHNTVQKIERARRATTLLKGGLSILDTVQETGYFDQSHLTNGLKRFMGQTPAQIVQMNTPD